MLIIDKHTNTADLAIIGTGNLQALFALALLNGLSITDDLTPGQTVDTPAEDYPAEPVQLIAVAEAYRLAFPVHSTIVDAQVVHGGFVDSLFTTALLNGLSITDDVAPGTDIIIEPAAVNESVQLVPFVAVPVKQLQKQQSIVDFVLQHTGSVEGLFDVALLNGNTPTAELQPGTVLSAAVLEQGIADYFINNGLQVSSSEVNEKVLPGGIGFMQIQTSFKVS